MWWCNSHRKIFIIRPRLEHTHTAPFFSQISIAARNNTKVVAQKDLQAELDKDNKKNQQRQKVMQEKRLSLKEISDGQNQ